MIEVKGFRCSHCDAAGRVRRTYASAQSCAKHERNCYMNTANRACATCALWVGDPGERNCENRHDRGPSGEGRPDPIMRCPHWQAKEGGMTIPIPEGAIGVNVYRGTDLVMQAKPEGE